MFEREGGNEYFGVLHRHGSPHQCDLVKLTKAARPRLVITPEMRAHWGHDGWFQSYQSYFRYEPNDCFDEFDIGAINPEAIWVLCM